MAQKRCNHAYGLQVVHCRACGAHIASRCPHCSYESRYDEDHRPGCSLADPPSARSRARGEDQREEVSAPPRT